MQTKDSSGIRLTFADADPIPQVPAFRITPKVQHSGVYCAVCNAEKVDDLHWFQVMADDTVFIIAPLYGTEVSEGFHPVCGEADCDRLKTQWFAHRHGNGKNGR